MTTPRRRRYLRLQLAWLLGALFALLLAGALSLGAYVLLAVLGSVVLDGLLTPHEVEPRWRPRWLVPAGLLVAAIVVAVRTLELLAPGVIP
ncbi:hypothetical protein [Natronococcus sp. A-GB7]|uniref:hypothetical protein n=1 Tax=Natronococcus sp. A-GB7 TaxID=3037649 RepID=UPI00241F95AD|nr:hypothetical protein [Natronococcus sp. A-GB7]MDG5819713.1 hypothetical protein [Natronococcus sp. A-GB7]